MATYLGTCHHDCPDSCGWIATVEDGIAVKLRGNPAHPYSLGELCPKVNPFLDRVYSPERLLHPLIRNGEKGEGRFERTSWKRALTHVADRLHEIVEVWGGEAVLPWWDAGTQGLIQMSALDRRFFGRLGASRLIGSLCGGTAAAGTATTNGTGLAADPMDVRFSRLILLWGTNTRLTNRHLWPFIEEARNGGAEVIVIDPIRTATARAADHFLQPLPGTDVAMMLAMMHVLIRDDLIDHDYVERHTHGFPDLSERVSGWPPDRAASLCGVPARDIERLARLYGTRRPTMIRTLIGAEHHENGAMFFRTLACLPALTGSWRDRGGGLARSTSSWADRHVDDSVFDWPDGDRRSINMNHLGRALIDPDLDPPVKALFVWNGNPLVTVPNASAIRRGLERDDLFTVVSEQFMTDTARFADVVLPAATQLEQIDLVPSWGHLYLGWNERAIDPLGEAVPNTELWRRLARAMGFTEPQLFEDDESLIRSALVDVDFETLRKEGFVGVAGIEDARPYQNGGFGTPHGKVAFFSGSPAGQGHDPLPRFDPPGESRAGNPELAARFPLILLTPKQHTRFLNSSYSHLPKHGPAEGGPFVELDADDAEQRGIAEGDLCDVWNDRARLRLPARISDRLRAGVVIVPFGWWAGDYGGDVTANSLTNDSLTDWGGGVAYSDTLVEVARSSTPHPDTTE